MAGPTSAGGGAGSEWVDGMCQGPAQLKERATGGRPGSCRGEATLDGARRWLRPELVLPAGDGHLQVAAPRPPSGCAGAPWGLQSCAPARATPLTRWAPTALPVPAPGIRKGPGAGAFEAGRNSVRLGDLGLTVSDLRSASKPSPRPRCLQGKQRPECSAWASKQQSLRGCRGLACPLFSGCWPADARPGCPAPREPRTFLAPGLQPSPNPAHVDSPKSADVRNLGGRNPPQSRRAASLLRMGGYLGTPGPPPPSRAEGRTDLPKRPVNRRPVQPLHQVHRVQHVHRAQYTPRLRPWRRPPTWDPAKPTAWLVSEAWRRFPMKTPQHFIVGPLQSYWRESYWKRRIWFPGHPRAVWSPVTIKSTPPERGGLPATVVAQVRSAASPPSEKPPGPCAKETVLRTRGECEKGRVRLQEPLLPERLDSERRSPDVRPSAFKPLMKSGERTSFVPRPGPLKRSLDSCSSDHSLSKRPTRFSTSSLANTQTGGLLSSKRNAITSSYSSSRDFSKRWNRSVPSISFQMPEWPIKKKQKGPQCHCPVPLVSEAPPAASGSAGQQSQETPRLLQSPGALLSLAPPPQLGYAVPGENLGLRTEAGLQWGHKTRKDATEVTTDSVPHPWSAVPPCLVLALPPAGAAPAPGTDPQVGYPGVLAFPQPAREGSGVAPSPLKSPSLLAPPAGSQSEPLPGLSSDAKPTAAVTLLTPASPTSPVTDTTQPPLTSQTDRSARSPDPPAITPVAPFTQTTLFGNGRRPTGPLAASAPPATTSADPTSKWVWGPPPNGETGDPSHSRTAGTAASCPPLGVTTLTFKPVFGSPGPLRTVPVSAPVSFKQALHPAPPASPHLSHGLATAASAVMSTTPASTSKDSSFKPPLDFGVVNVTSTVGNTYSPPSTGDTSLVGAALDARTSFSPATGFTFPPHQCPTVPVAHRVAVVSQALPRAVHISPSRNTADFRGTGSPLPASALVTTNQPALSSDISNLTSTFTVPLGSSSKPPFPLSLGVTPQAACGGSGEQKQGAPQPALGPSFNSSSIFGNPAVPSPTPTPTPTPAWPAFRSPTPSASGVLTPSASAVQAGPDTGSAPVDLPFDKASATQAHRRGVGGSVFGSTAPRPFAFGGLVTPMDCGEPEDSVTAPDKSSNSGVFCAGATPRGAPCTIKPFRKVCSQSTPGLTSQSTPSASGRDSISARKTVFGALHMVSFAQSTPIPGPVKVGSSLGFGIPSPPAQGSAGRGSFRPSAPSFSFGVKPKPPKNREPRHSRRHRAHKK